MYIVHEHHVLVVNCLLLCCFSRTSGWKYAQKNYYVVLHCFSDGPIFLSPWERGAQSYNATDNRASSPEVCIPYEYEEVVVVESDNPNTSNSENPTTPNSIITSQSQSVVSSAGSVETSNVRHNVSIGRSDDMTSWMSNPSRFNPNIKKLSPKQDEIECDDATFALSVSPKLCRKQSEIENVDDSDGDGEKMSHEDIQEFSQTMGDDLAIPLNFRKKMNETLFYKENNDKSHMSHAGFAKCNPLNLDIRPRDSMGQDQRRIPSSPDENMTTSICTKRDSCSNGIEDWRKKQEQKQICRQENTEQKGGTIDKKYGLKWSDGCFVKVDINKANKEYLKRKRPRQLQLDTFVQKRR